MSEHKFNRPVLFFLHVLDFAHPDVPRSLPGVENRMQLFLPCLLRILVVSNPHLKSQSRSHRHNPMEYQVVPNRPWHATEHSNPAGEDRFRKGSADESI